jgi:hypothetical protein
LQPGSLVVSTYKELKSNFPSKPCKSREGSKEHEERSSFRNFYTERDSTRLEMSPFSKKLQSTRMNGASNGQEADLHGEKDLTGKPIFLNPDKIRSFIAKIQSKEKQDGIRLSEKPKQSSTVRNLDDSKNLLFNTGRGKLDSKLIQPQLNPSMTRKQPRENMHINLPDENQNGVETNAEQMERNPPRYFARRCLSQAKLTKQTPGDRSSRGEHPDSYATDHSKVFLRTIDNCLSQLAFSQMKASQHKRGQSSIEVQRRAAPDSFSRPRRTEGQVEKSRESVQDRPGQHKQTSSRRDCSADDSKSVVRDTPTEIDTLIAQNDALKNKVSKLKAKIKEENICKEYWQEKFKDLEKRYNSLILKNLRKRDDGLVGKKMKAEPGHLTERADPNGAILTSATTDSNYHLNHKK